MKAIIVSITLLAACVTEPAPLDSAAMPDPYAAACVPSEVATPCTTPWDYYGTGDLSGWCITTPTQHGVNAACNPKCGDRGACPAGWQPVIVNAVCVCGEI